ncbi:MAG: glutamyl-tRNA amidotransferase [Gammaproteobacteria bacterium RIFCSPLOWO2_02_FULL_61_13]|nr:MAG: glutamyl-tRNA amidotransferase [Gammaproteobacteria bacterium RIFCSPLOWO2_02_FULL_61_13]
MRAQDKERLGTLRLISAGIKQREVDERIQLDDTHVLAVLDKMARQHRDSIAQFESAGRHDLVKKEQSELSVVISYLPQPLSEAEVVDLIKAAITETGAASAKDMGKVMGILKPKVQGRFDMGKVGGMVKGLLP